MTYNSALGELLQAFIRPDSPTFGKSRWVTPAGYCIVLFRLGDQCKDPHLQSYESMKAGSCSQKLEFHQNKVNGLILSSYARKINL